MPPSAIPASAAFDRLDTRLQRWLWEQRWGALRPIQEEAIDALLDHPDRDVLLAAPTASGKTEAAFLPLCTRLLARRDREGDAPGRGFDLLYVSPLKALINDQWGRLDRLCEALEIPVHRWHGDVSAVAKQKAFNKPDGVLLITPESLEALFVRRGTQVRRLFASVEAVVIDELHAFFGSERGRQLQSLLHRLEAATGRTIPRVGLSATLSDLSAAARFLRPGAPADGNAICLAPPSGAAEIQAQIRGYVRREFRMPGGLLTAEQIAQFTWEGVDSAAREADEEAGEQDARDAADAAIASHLFSVLRGRQNLVFCNSRNEVERFADRLARLSEEARVPNEFFAHHGSLGKELRYDVEERLRDGERPVTAVCTSTLELGIDIGAMYSVAQIGAAPSVAALRQRLGRSGRREGEPSRLRVYTRESELTPQTPLIDRLRLETVQAIAQISLVVRGWCEPPDQGDGLHLSTLIQQTLSVLAERGGIGASPLWKLLCRTGPFRAVDQATFVAFLQALHAAGLVVQSDDGTLLPGPTGERLVDHYTFYAAFATPEEYRLVAQGRSLGTLPIERPLVEGSYLIFAGKRWKVLSVDEGRRLIDLAPAPGGRAPEFGGVGVWVDAEVRAEMRRLYESLDVPPFLDKQARALLAEGRDEYARRGLHDRNIIVEGGETHIFLFSSDKAAATLYLELLRRGIGAEENGVCVTASTKDEMAVRAVLERIAAEGFAPPEQLAAAVPNAEEEKHDHFLPPTLRARQYAARCLDVVAAREAVRRALETPA